MIKIIFFDIDGTLRPFETGRVPASTQAALRRAHEAGILCAIATGRHWMEIRNENLTEGMRFDAFVTMDGEFCYVLDPKKVDAAIVHGEHLRHEEPYRFDVKNSPEPMAYFDPRNGRVVQRIEIPRSAVEKVLALCEEQPFACLFEEERAIYANMVTPELLSVLKHINSAQPPVRPVQEALENPIYMMIPIMTLDEADVMEARVPECELVRWSDGMSFDLTKKGISKVSGIDALLELRHMGNDADKTAGALQIDQCIHRTIQCFRIQRTEALVDEHGIEVYAALPCLHDIGKPEGK